MHLGNYLGAVKNWVAHQDDEDSVFCIVDLHALTQRPDGAELRHATVELGAMLLAAGLDPRRCTLFVQSHVPEHSELSWIMECTASYGELGRMVQFKDKRERAEFVSAGLFTYPALQAADILLYDTDRVPVGADQRQHIELARDLAERFNGRYGETFVVPEHVIPAAGARVMDLQRPEDKMSKSLDSPQGTVLLTDDPGAIRKKFKRAVTDSEGVVAYDPEGRPGVSNLLSIFGGVTGEAPETIAERYDQYGPLKTDCGDAVVAALEPLQARLEEFRADPAEVERQLALGADKARTIAAEVLARAQMRLGIGPRGRE